MQNPSNSPLSNCDQLAAVQALLKQHAQGVYDVAAAMDTLQVFASRLEADIAAAPADVRSPEFHAGLRESYKAVLAICLARGRTVGGNQVFNGTYHRDLAAEFRWLHSWAGHSLEGQPDRLKGCLQGYEDIALLCESRAGIKMRGYAVEAEVLQRLAEAVTGLLGDAPVKDVGAGKEPERSPEFYKGLVSTYDALIGVCRGRASAGTGTPVFNSAYLKEFAAEQSALLRREHEVSAQGLDRLDGRAPSQGWLKGREQGVADVIQVCEYRAGFKFQRKPMDTEVAGALADAILDLKEQVASSKPREQERAPARPLGHRP